MKSNGNIRKKAIKKLRQLIGKKRRNKDNSRKKFFNASREREAREEEEIKADKEIRRKGKRWKIRK